MSTATTRKGDWVQTYTGKAFWPMDPQPEDVCIEDIAHALSNLCRFGGACRHFYSVAEHSIAVSYLVPTEAALYGLLHDASEAYLMDLPRPIKQFMPNYRGAELLVLQAIAIRFRMPFDYAGIVKYADDQMLHTEMLAMMSRAPMEWAIHMPPPIPHTFAYYTPEEAEAVFLHRWEELTA